MFGNKCPQCRNQILPGVNLEMIEMMKDETIIKKENVVEKRDENNKNKEQRKTINQEKEQLISELSFSAGTRATEGGRGRKGSPTRPFVHLCDSGCRHG